MATASLRMSSEHKQKLDEREELKSNLEIEFAKLETQQLDINREKNLVKLNLNDINDNRLRIDKEIKENQSKIKQYEDNMKVE
ncbi:unnamed protein product, partial [Didymodactylos carnosus]